MTKSVLALLLLCSACAVAQQPALDSDRDGLSDSYEQTLLEQFRPTVMISPTDCALKPARFLPDQAQPKVAAVDGTIYGQVFPVSSTTVEIHYYTLWNRDCGKVGHPLDAEHVAVLVSTETSEPHALYWYAGAHEKTVCDISSGARAKAIDAESRGPVVWSSKGKHALYLKQEMCQAGCGADTCKGDVELPASGPVINVGELSAPANGATWTKSADWLLADKMTTNFRPEVIARIDAAPETQITTLRGRSTVRGAIQGSGTVVDAGGIGAQHTGAALDTAQVHSSNSLGTATRATGRSLKKAWKAVFGSKQDQPESKPSEKK